ncbi:MAG TPA: ABC transporter permease [Thermoanaerobaculia bacterium]
MNALAFEVALRYVRSRPSRLISSVSLLSIGGIALGVAALVVAMGLLTGYRTEIRERLIGANAAVVVFPLIAGGESDTTALEARLGKVAGVRAVAPVIYQTGVASSTATPDGTDAVLKGIDADTERKVSDLDAYLPDAARAVTKATPDAPASVAIGYELAHKLDVREGDPVVLAVADNALQGGRFAPRTGRFRVGRVFRTNFAEYDSEWIFMDRQELRRLARLEGAANVVEIRLNALRDTESVVTAVRAAAGNGYSVSDWRSMNGGLFAMLVIQQAALFLVIGLIVAVSTFNIVATLVMTVQEKKRDIGVLTTLGAEPRLLRRIFLWLGALLGGTGVVAGVLFGVAVCWAATRFRLLSFPAGVAEIYFVSFIPFLVRIRDLAAIVLFSAAAILVASWVPARRAGRLDVAEALRYE